MTASAFIHPEAVRAARGFTALPDWGVIRARGDDAASFLHGQLTQDMVHLDSGVARLAGYCSPKGRLLATFVIWRAAPDEVLMACSADLLQATLKRLSMFVLRARCQLSDASPEFALFGVAGSDLPPPWRTATADGATCVGLPPALGVARALWVGRAGTAPAHCDPLEPAVWDWLEVASGVPRIVEATREQFVPQMVNLELVGGVNFQTGCYPGQEVVARSQSRGTLKRRAALFASPQPARPGQEVVHADDPGQPAGLVAGAASLGGQHLLLVETKLTALEGGALHLGQADGPVLTPVPLPYDVAVDATA